MQEEKVGVEKPSQEEVNQLPKAFQKTDRSDVFKGHLDPTDLSTLPKDFYDSELYKERPSLANKDELAHLRTVVATFFNYKNDSFRDLAKMERDFYNMSEESKKYVADIRENRVEKMRQCINHNYSQITQMVEEYSGLFQWSSLASGDSYLPYFEIDRRDAGKLRYSIRQIVREWTEEGRKFRDSCFNPVIEVLEKEFPDRSTRNGKKVLCPGAGLFRLPYEFATRGFSSQGNEFSYFMLIIANYIMNEVEDKNQCSIFSNIHSFCNKLNENDSFQMFQFPDVKLTDHLGSSAEFSMTAGEFIEVYTKKPDSWDSVVTCFFLDTAHNVVDYMLAIYKILKKGGVWVNVGPLLYHFADMENEMSIELSWDEIRKVATDIGFTIELEDDIKGVYVNGGQSMMETVYLSKLIKARK